MILNLPEPLDSDTQHACKALRKGMFMRCKWLNCPIEPQIPHSPLFKKPRPVPCPRHHSARPGSFAHAEPIAMLT
jgi:hypothetical protein